MTENARIFNEYLKTQDINLNFLDNNGQTIVELNEVLEGGIKARLGILFNETDSLISVIALDFIGGINSSKRNKILDLVNELNSGYSYYKFVVINDSIQIQSFISVDNNFEPSILMNYIFGMFDVIKDDYSTIMKAMWS
ncbi:hypothetical protein [Clostridium perfringens]|uniref:hypothetical protein n=1 Tax=Clostridium perfringens TaxID=1502 RepID=UPI00232BC9E8|nr:hypothetical protein [Clostridium perfringens]MDB2049848.1 hypothetical protein [Clostridium perfringens]